jgi:hypothetical protein
MYEGLSKNFQAESITKSTTMINTRWEAMQSVMAVKLTRLTHKITIQLHLMAESWTICSSRSRRPVRKLLDTPSHIKDNFSLRVLCQHNLAQSRVLLEMSEHDIGDVFWTDLAQDDILLLLLSHYSLWLFQASDFLFLLMDPLDIW